MPPSGPNDFDAAQLASSASSLLRESARLLGQVKKVACSLEDINPMRIAWLKTLATNAVEKKLLSLDYVRRELQLAQRYIQSVRRNAIQALATIDICIGFDKENNRSNQSESSTTSLTTIDARFTMLISTLDVIGQQEISHELRNLIKAKILLMHYVHRNNMKLAIDSALGVENILELASSLLCDIDDLLSF